MISGRGNNKLIQKLGLGVFGLSVFGLVGCAGSHFKSEEKQSRTEPILRIIDAHTHLDSGGLEPNKSKEEMLKVYLLEQEKAQVVGSVVLTQTLSKTSYVDTHGKNIVQCAGLAIPGPLPYSQLERDLSSKRFRCIKIYLGYIQRYASDPEYQRVYKMAERYQVPVVFHTGDVSRQDGLLKYSDPLTIDEVAVKNRKVTFVIAHCGNPWIQSAAEVAYKNDNVYLDGSAFLTGDLDQTSPEKIDEYMIKPLKWVFGFIENPNKLMFGTDWPLTKMAPYVAAFKKAIPKQYWQKVFHDNAVKVFGMNP